METTEQTRIKRFAGMIKDKLQCGYYISSQEYGCNDTTHQLVLDVLNSMYFQHCFSFSQPRGHAAASLTVSLSESLHEVISTDLWML